jgi:lysophospholipase L1-like esterase
MGSNGLKLSGIGDSIMQGFDAAPCDLPICFEQPEYSFAQGTSVEVDSLYLRFEQPGIEFVSATGSEMVLGSNNAKAQANRLCGQATRANRIVILLGANDICNADSVAALPTAETFVNALGAALATLAAEDCNLPKGSQVHVISVPRVDLLHAAGLAKSGVNCPTIWHNFGICALATESPAETTLQAIATMVDAYNQAIVDTIASVQSTVDVSRKLEFTTDYVGTSENSSFGTYAFVPDDLSNLDCFHPSIQGQRKLACLAWETWQGNGAVAGCLE